MIQPVAIVEYFALSILAIVTVYFAYLFLFHRLNRIEKTKLLICFIFFWPPHYFGLSLSNSPLH